MSFLYPEDAGFCTCPECSSTVEVDPFEEESFEKDPPISEEEWLAMEREIDG